MLQIWRGTLVLISIMLFSQYSFRVFSPNDYLFAVKHRKESNLLCLSGLIMCVDDPAISTAFSNLELINLKLYVPYYALLIIFILAYFILSS